VALTIPQAELADLVTRLTSQDYTVNWDGDPQPFVAPVQGGPGVHIVLGIKGNTAIGVDEERRTDVVVGGVPVQRVETCGNRKFLLTVKIESATWDVQTWDVAEVLRTRIRSSASRAFLQAAGLALSTIGPFQSLGGTWDNRAVDVGYLELTFCWAATDVQTENDGGVIETVNGDDVVPGTVTH